MPAALDPFDELAALFLSEEPSPGVGDAPGRSGSGAVKRAAVDVTLVGNLPVMGSLWLSQLAEVVARRAGETALVRFDLDQPTIELFHAADKRRATTPVSAHELSGLATGIHHWIIRAPLGASYADILKSAPDRLAILTGADEAAVVAAYRMIKDVVEACGASGEVPPLGLVIVGAEPTRVREVSEKLSRTASSFIGVQAPLLESIQRMDAVDAAGPRPLAGDVTLDSVIQIARSARIESRPCVEVTTPSAPAPLRDMPPETTRRRAPGSARYSPAEAAYERPADASPPAAGFRMPPKPVLLAAAAPAPASDSSAAAAPAPTSGRSAPDLCASLDGVTRIAVRCPSTPNVELAVDSGGQLHLLAWEPDLASLLRAQIWSAQHRELLAMAVPQLRDAASPVMHLFSESPAALAAHIGSPFRLHILAPVEVEGRTGWYAAALA